MGAVFQKGRVAYLGDTLKAGVCVQKEAREHKQGQNGTRKMGLIMVRNSHGQETRTRWGGVSGAVDSGAVRSRKWVVSGSFETPSVRM